MPVDLGAATAGTPVAGAPGRSTCTLTADWEIWGPMGGYVAAVALRAAGAVSRFARPASFACQYLGVAEFGPVDLEVTALRSGRATDAFRVSMTQQAADGRTRAILEALVRAVAPTEGLDHDEAEPPDVPGPAGVPSARDRLPDDAPFFPFWDNLEERPLDWSDEWPPTGPVPARFREWFRFVPTPTFDDPWVDACRSVILLDLLGWPAGHRPHAWREPPFVAPNLDLYVAFHQPAPEEEWLLGDGVAPIGAEGLIGYTGQLWSSERRLVASGGGQLLCRPVTPG